MATIKSYTDLSQSKKLAKILPVESADMYYKTVLPQSPNLHKIPEIGNPIEDLEWYNKGYTLRGKKEPLTLEEYCLPCWSLATLLGLIPKRINDYNVLRIDISNSDFAIWYDEIGYGVNNDLPNITAKSAVDACYEMILKLHELNLL